MTRAVAFIVRTGLVVALAALGLLVAWLTLRIDALAIGAVDSVPSGALAAVGVTVTTVLGVLVCLGLGAGIRAAVFPDAPPPAPPSGRAGPMWNKSTSTPTSPRPACDHADAPLRPLSDQEVSHYARLVDAESRDR